jgi:hypothetical protein
MFGGKKKEEEYLNTSLQTSPFPEFVNPQLASEGTRPDQQKQPQPQQQLFVTRPQVMGELMDIKRIDERNALLQIAVPMFAKNKKKQDIPTNVSRLTLGKIVVIQ